MCVNHLNAAFEAQNVLMSANSVDNTTVGWESSRDSGMGDTEYDIGEFGRRASSRGEGDCGNGSVDDVRAQIAMQGSIRYNGGGHVNHSFFWTGLAPVSLLVLYIHISDLALFSL